MKTISFKKFNATGNDFIIIDNRDGIIKAENKDLWANLCALKTGIGADGVLLVEKSSEHDFKMRYINADGGEVAMCGNGARAITAFVHEELKFNKEIYKFETMNSVYECSLDKDFGYKLLMTELYDVEKYSISDLLPAKNSRFLNTGVPHCVFEVADLDKFNVYEKGKEIRYNPRFTGGTNANFYQYAGNNQLKIRTYERGVENETLSCGTGAVATALTAAYFYQLKDQITLLTKGGELAVRFTDDLKAIYLCGKVQKVFEGSFQIT